MAAEVFLPRRSDGPEESLAAFVRRRFGREALERAAQPLVSGIYAGDPERLSARAALGRMVELEEAHRSVILGLRRVAGRNGAPDRGDSGARWSLFASLDGGLGVMVERLQERLAARVRTSTPVDAVRRRPEGGWEIPGAGTYDALILATPAHAAASILAGAVPSAARLLEEIRYASTAVLTFAYRREALPLPLGALGLVVPAVERRPLLALSFASLKFPHRAPAALLLVRVFVGGMLRPGDLEVEDAALLARTHQELRRLLGVLEEPVHAAVTRHERAMPQYEVGHAACLRRLATVLAGAPGLFLAGAAYHGVGIPDCIRSGEQAAEAAWAYAASGGAS